MTPKAPGRSERKGNTITDLFAKFPDDRVARRWFESTRWKDGRFFPLRGSTKTRHNHIEKPLYCQGGTCRCFFSFKTGTAMHPSKIGLQNWSLVIYFMPISLEGVSSVKLHRNLCVSQKSAWMIDHKIRQGWVQRKPKLDDEGEVDRTYIDCKESNKHENKELHVGRGAVVGVNQRSGELHVRHLQDTSDNTLHGELLDNVKESTTFYSDEHKGYRGIDLFFNHETVKHSVRECVNSKVRTNKFESFGASMKRGYEGTHHKMSPKHLQRLVAEFVGRHNVCGLDTISQIEHVDRNFDDKRLTYAEMIADNGLDADAT